MEYKNSIQKDDIHMKKEHTHIYFFMAAMLIYFLIFLLSLYNFQKNTPTIDIGLNPQIINITIMALTILGIIKSVYTIKKY